MGLQSTLSPPNRKRDVSDTAVSVCHERPKGATVEDTISDHVHEFKSRQNMSLVLVSCAESKQTKPDNSLIWHMHLLKEHITVAQYGLLNIRGLIRFIGRSGREQQSLNA